MNKNQNKLAALVLEQQMNKFSHKHLRYVLKSGSMGNPLDNAELMRQVPQVVCAACAFSWKGITFLSLRIPFS